MKSFSSPELSPTSPGLLFGRLRFAPRMSFFWPGQAPLLGLPIAQAPPQRDASLWLTSSWRF